MDYKDFKKLLLGNLEDLQETIDILKELPFETEGIEELTDEIQQNSDEIAFNLECDEPEKIKERICMQIDSHIDSLSKRLPDSDSEVITRDIKEIIHDLETLKENLTKSETEE